MESFKSLLLYTFKGDGVWKALSVSLEHAILKLRKFNLQDRREMVSRTAVCGSGVVNTLCLLSESIPCALNPVASFVLF